jgi:hypothetical protein
MKVDLADRQSRLYRPENRRAAVGGHPAAEPIRLG